MDDAIDGAGGPDGHGEDGDGGEGETGRTVEVAQAEAKILAKSLEHGVLGG